MLHNLRNKLSATFNMEKLYQGRCVKEKVHKFSSLSRRISSEREPEQPWSASRTFK